MGEVGDDGSAVQGLGAFKQQHRNEERAGAQGVWERRGEDRADLAIFEQRNEERNRLGRRAPLFETHDVGAGGGAQYGDQSVEAAADSGERWRLLGHIAIADKENHLVRSSSFLSGDTTEPSGSWSASLRSATEVMTSEMLRAESTVTVRSALSSFGLRTPPAYDAAERVTLVDPFSWATAGGKHRK